ncbi:Crp/Fnr family transcriptional regulator [Dinghuibacter silviterrae]|uniref:CRP-like cAMP-binding protein n=1 Tax=Dinghuibacter silviterrae TaxID=1539049 RepID=A0A4R8DUM4_9BACT|nr:Crp/Fnr family transcriptional regulator [Dinghuibacter silviterrae]TDX02090.1 CRP-like cAMP-binding protein [Dinghuibacter silviterrae]
MFDVFAKHMKGRLTTNELRQLEARATFKKLRRRQVLLQEGEIGQHKVFVTKGLLRAFFLADDGTEHILRFAAENTWIADHESYHKGTPAKYNIDALEDSELLLWARKDMRELMDTIPALQAYTNSLMAGVMDQLVHRNLMNISYTSEAKYEDFIKTYPDIFQRVPLHMVASFLGVSRETLTRIRHASPLKHS